VRSSNVNSILYQWLRRGQSIPDVKRYPDPPSDDELDAVIAPDEHYPFAVEEIDGINGLRRRIRDIIFVDDNSLEGWSKLVGDCITYGNKKIADSTAIFNVGSAHDCVNLGTKYCQVDEEDCYAVRSEKAYPGPIHYRRKQAIIWSLLDGVTFARAFRMHYERKRNEVDSLRFNESGDFQARHEILKLETIGQRLNDIVDTYTYSASADLPWKKDVHSVTVNQSNDIRDYGVRRFEVVDDVENIPDDGIRCPNDLDESIQCGDCKICIDEGAGDVYVKNFYADDEAGSGDGDERIPVSEYRDALAEALPDGWTIRSFEQENNTARDATIFDAVLVHRESRSIVQAVPHRNADGNGGYDANRVRTQNGPTNSEYYIGLAATEMNIPQSGSVSELVSRAASHRDALLDDASYPAQASVHDNSISPAVGSRIAFWTPEMALVAMLTAAYSVSSEISTQQTLGGF